MFAAAKSDFEPDIIERSVEQVSETIRRRRCDIERQMRQQVVDQVGLMDAKLVALAAAEERTAPVRCRAVVGRNAAICGFVGSRYHRSVWYSRYSSRARGSIEEMYICS
jgi:hypothetical protein